MSRKYIYGDGLIWRVAEITQDDFEEVFDSPMASPAYSLRLGRWRGLPVGVFQDGPDHDPRLSAAGTRGVTIYHYDDIPRD